MTFVKVHRIWVKQGDLIAAITNPEASVTDPAGLIGTTISKFLVCEEGGYGVHLVPSLATVVKLSDRVRTEDELRAIRHFE